MHHQINQLMAGAIQSFQSSNLDQAEQISRQVLKIQSNHFDALHLLGVVRGLKNQSDEALEFFRKALKIDPNNSLLNFNIAKAFSEIGEEEKAVKYHLRTTELNPTHPQAWQNFGKSLFNLRKFNDSLDCFNKALDFYPEYAEAWSSRGCVQTELDQYEDALTSCKKAISIQPNYAEAWSNLGNVFSKLNQYEQALVSYDKAISIKPAFADAWTNRGNALIELTRYEQALSSFEKAISIAPDCANSWTSRGYAFFKLNQYEQALASYDKAISINPDFADAWCNRANVLVATCQFELAEASCREAIRISPSHTLAQKILLFNLNYLDTASPQEAFKEAREYGISISQKSIPKFDRWSTSSATEKLKIGFISGDFRNHPVGYFVESLFSHLDQTKFEIFAFPTVATTDDLTDRLKPFLMDWTPIYGKSDFDAASLIHQKGIHILVDLAGHTANNRLPVFSYKPAPVQASWLGYFSTTGLPEIDYFLGDPHLSPPSESKFFTETLWNLPETWLCQAPHSFELPVSDLPALSNGYITFACFANLSKINDRVVSTWASLLRQVPQSKLLIKSKQLADATQINRIQNWFKKFDIAPDRLLLEAPETWRNYFSAYNRVDIILDTFPYPGGTTSVDALWMGVPILTLKGDRFLSRLGESIAINAGNQEWIAEDVQDYVLKAVEFSSDLERLAQQRGALRSKILKSPLFDAKRFAKSFGDELLAIWLESTKQMHSS